MSGSGNAPSSLPAGSYRLLPHQIPDYPSSDQWVDLLHWCIVAMGPKDDDLGFAASLLSHAADKGGLTEKQGKYAKRMLDRVRALWMAGELDCQSPPTVPSDDAHGLHDMATAGRA